MENLETLVNLQELYIGKNKITKLAGLGTLTELTLLSIQVEPALNLVGW